ncbi:hypothetical protein [Nocardia rosealba]|uniref:hypothetical protein n=1 Tax=Nocardia rosealba TaxID=2878563 RepID=UPI001CD94058|nr:hypothetical protein [Nocardia rosealba]MCA2210565.1 hypothetical protein [Nocardia rosealba]
MVTRTDPINQTQFDVLRWVDAGCPDGEMTGSAYKVSARALEWRGLVVLTKHGGVWRAEVTDACRHYLEYRKYPDDHWASRKPARKREPGSQATRLPTKSAVARNVTPSKLEVGHDPASGTQRRPPPHATARIAEERRAAAHSLIDELTANKQFIVHDLDESALAEWRKVVDFAKRHKMIPVGCRVEKTRYGRNGLLIMLVEGIHPNAKPPVGATNSSIVPNTIEEWHPLLAGLKDPGAGWEVSAPLIPRVRRFLHVLLTECTTRGYQVRWSREENVGVVITDDDQEYRLVVTEVTEKRDVLPSQEELGTRKTYAWQRVQAEGRIVPTGRLAVALFSSRWDRRNWSDRRAWTIEDKLPAILAELMSRVHAKRDRKAESERRLRQEQQAWDTAVDRARGRFQENLRVAALDSQLSDWEKAEKIRLFCDECEAVPTADEDIVRRDEWLAWCRSYADRIDPVLRGARAPQLREPTSEDLRPHMPPGMNRYRP